MWIAPRDVRLGHDYSEELQDGIGSSAAVVALISDDANRPDGYEVAEKIAADLASVTGRKEGRDGLDALLAGRGVDVVTFQDWQRIEAAEAARAREGSPREKFVAIEEMLGARKG